MFVVIAGSDTYHLVVFTETLDEHVTACGLPLDYARQEGRGFTEYQTEPSQFTSEFNRCEACLAQDWAANPQQPHFQAIPGIDDARVRHAQQQKVGPKRSESWTITPGGTNPLWDVTWDRLLAPLPDEDQQQPGAGQGEEGQPPARDKGEGV